MTTRRNFLKNGFTVAGLASAAGLLPDAVKRAHAITPDPGTTFLNAEHVVILMQENRSFDHLFGTMRGVRGFGDPRPLAQADGSPIFLQRNPAGGGHAPWRLNMTDSCFTWLGSLPHGRTDQVDAWNGGAHNNWIDAKRHRDHPDLPLTMGYHARQDVPFYYALADAFTVCDQYYCSVMSSTSPNRMMMWSGTIREPNALGSLVYMRNEQTHPGGLAWTAFPERLEKAGIEWKIYQNDVWCETLLPPEEHAWLGNDGDNMLERFESVPVNFAPSFLAYSNNLIDKALANLAARRQLLQRERDALALGSPERAGIEMWLQSYAAQEARLERKRTVSVNDLSRITPAGKAMRARALQTNASHADWHALETIDFTVGGKRQSSPVPKGDIFHQFREDVRSGKLPAISWLVAPSNFSAHPSKPLFGAWYVSEAMNILTENPEVWKKTIFILTFDENDGFFDHAPSYVAADPQRPDSGGATPGIDVGQEYTVAEDEMIQGVAPENARSGPIGLGYRVPTIVASPWSRGGWVNSEISDHSSIIRFLERFIEGKSGKKLRDDNISAWRRTVCGDLTSCFRGYDPRSVALPRLDQHRHVQEIVGARSQPLPSGYRLFDADEIKAARGEPAALDEILWQEPGVKPSCALPYELHADPEIDFEAGRFSIRLAAGNGLLGARASGAPFNIYRYGAARGTDPHPVTGLPQDMAAGTYVVGAGESLPVAYPLADIGGERYDVAVHGPNGFYRRFRGNDTVARLSARTRHEVKRGTVRLLLDVTNRSDRPLDLTAAACAYVEWEKRRTLAPGETVSFAIPVRQDQNWYDVSVRAAEASILDWRFSGRLETGGHSISDPVMGSAGTLRRRVRMAGRRSDRPG